VSNVALSSVTKKYTFYNIDTCLAIRLQITFSALQLQAVQKSLDDALQLPPGSNVIKLFTVVILIIFLIS
jgi:hypothetical protein